MIICKFGGTSVANLKNLKNIKKIVSSDNDRSIIIVSAPGRTDTHEKVTDILISLYNEKSVKEKKEKLNKIYQIYNEIKQTLNVKIDLESIFYSTFFNYETFSFAKLVSRGEYLSSMLLSSYLNLPFVDASNIIFFKDNSVDITKTTKKLKQFHKRLNRFITGGFYGSDEYGNIKLFSRGGSDVTGALIAKCLRAEIYENWSDIDGIYEDFETAKEQKIVVAKFETAQKICENGASIVHKDVFYYLKKSKCKIIVKNTANPLNFGTLII